MSNSKNFDWIRHPTTAGTFYPAAKDRLRAAVRRCLDAAPDKQFVDPYGIVVPHAGYLYSAPIAAHAFRAIERHPFDTAVLIGRSHRAQFAGVAVDNSAANETPLGRIPVDREIVSWLLGQSGVSADRHVIVSEHALEVELPFLQIIRERFSLVGLLLGSEKTESTAAAARTLCGLRCAFPKKKILFVCSTDLSHYYEYAEAARIDRAFSDLVSSGDVEALERAVLAHRVEACGAAAVIALLKAAREDGVRIVTILDLRNSGDTAGDTDRVVGYLAAVVGGTPA